MSSSGARPGVSAQELASGSPKVEDTPITHQVVDPNSPQRVNRLSSAEACKHPWLRAHEAAANAAVATAVERPAADALVEAVRAAAQEAAGLEAVADEAQTAEG